MQGGNKIRSYRDFLQKEFIERKSRNPSYSIRAYARDLKISKTALSEVLTSRRHLSRKNVLTVSELLSFSPSQKEKALQEVKKGKNGKGSQENIRYIEDDVFDVMSEWYYYAILNLARIKGCLASPKWISKRIGISSVEAKIAIDRLVRLGFISAKNGKLYRNSSSIMTKSDVPSSARRKYHKQNLRLAEERMDSIPVEEKEYCSMTMTVDPQKISKAKEKIRKFRQELSDFMEAGSQKEVYQLAIQLFPLTIGRKQQ